MGAVLFVAEQIPTDVYLALDEESRSPVPGLDIYDCVGRQLAGRNFLYIPVIRKLLVIVCLFYWCRLHQIILTYCTTYSVLRIPFCSFRHRRHPTTVVCGSVQKCSILLVYPRLPAYV